MAASMAGGTDLGFEGAEKKIEVDFILRDGQGEVLAPDGGLRTLPAAFWDEVCGLIDGTVLMRSQQPGMDLLLITESSMFVYADKLIMLTCGTTRLLNSLERVLDEANSLGLVVSWFQYSHKNFMAPERQSYPHHSMESETNFLRRIFREGMAHVLGPVSGDHWYLFMSDYIEREEETNSPSDVDQMLNIYMYDIDPGISQLFYKQARQEQATGGSAAHDLGQKGTGNVESRENDDVSSPAALRRGSATAEETSLVSGLRDALSGMGGRIVHEHLFDPCGYSVNGVFEEVDDAYWTMHVTPESNCSYASFETNLKCESYEDLIRRIVTVFAPLRFQTIEHVDQDSVLGRQANITTLSSAVTQVGRHTYRMRNRVINEFEPGYLVQMCNFHVYAPRSWCPPTRWVLNKVENDLSDATAADNAATSTLAADERVPS